MRELCVTVLQRGEGFGIGTDKNKQPNKHKQIDDSIVCGFVNTASLTQSVIQLGFFPAGDPVCDNTTIPATLTGLGGRGKGRVFD